VNKVYFGDCRASLRQMAADGIKAQMCVTSPPYFGLRDYGHDGQLGLEETPEQYIANMVEVFRCVRDVLSDDGTLWVNIGDSYFSSGKSDGASSKSGLNHGKGVRPDQKSGMAFGRAPTPKGCKSKDLIGIPWMLAFALRADGWYLRQDIIWHKPNPMPESVTDRCTKSHEYIFMLSKAGRYFYDADAIKEAAVSTDIKKFTDNGADKQRGHSRRHAGFNGRYAEKLAEEGVPEVRNKRSVWTVATKPYSGAHFATYPPELIEPCILAGSRIGDIVLDPFFGSGTTGEVALHLGRQYIGCEINRAYEALQNERTRQTGLAFA
jgi:DNA modification methylase